MQDVFIPLNETKDPWARSMGLKYGRDQATNAVVMRAACRLLLELCPVAAHCARLLLCRLERGRTI